MLIQLIQDSAEEKFLKALEESQRGVNWCVLYCAFSRVPLIADADEILIALKGILSDHHAEMYWCRDGDMTICWRGNAKRVCDAVTEALTRCYQEKLKNADTSRVFVFYDSHAQAEDLQHLFRKKVKVTPDAEGKEVAAPAPAAPPIPTGPIQTDFSPEQLILLRHSIRERERLTEPTTLIVEDQPFSRSLLEGVLRRVSTCAGAANAKEAFATYAAIAPCITFLDVELPDLDGHTLARLFKKYDPKGYIIMVTANNYVKDVELARANKVQGYIIKPYNKQKIMDAIDAYMKKKKGKR